MKSLKNTRHLALAAILIAVYVLLTPFVIYVSDNLRIAFTFFVAALIGLCFSPISSFAMGFAIDLLGFIVFPSGPFFPGYALSTACSLTFYSLFFHQKRITVTRIAIAKLCVNVFVHVLLNSLWSAMLYSKGYLFYMMNSIVKNILMYPLEVILLVLFFQLLLPTLQKKNLAIPQSSKIQLF